MGNGGYATETNIENAVISFKVAKSWLQDKQIDESTITLYRYNDVKWNKLTTSLSSEDENYLHFTAQTPGFSPFAITGQKLKETREIVSTESTALPINTTPPTAVLH